MKIAEIISEALKSGRREKRELIAGVLRRVIRTILVMIVIGYMLVPFIFERKLASSLILTALLIVNVAATILMRRGRLKVACVTLVAGVWLIFTVLVLFGGGVDNVNVVFYLSMTVVAGLLLGQRVAVITAAFSIAVSLGMAVLGVLDLMPPRYFQSPPMADWAQLTFAIILTVSALNLAIRIRDDATKALSRQLTDRLQAERALSESEALYRTAFEESNDGVVIVRDGQYLYVNQRFLSTLNCTGENLLGKPYGSFMHPDDREMSRRYHQLRSEGQEAPRNYEARLVRTDGVIRYVNISTSDVFYQGERAVLAYIRDITEKRQAEAVLKASEERFRSLIQSSSDIIIVLDNQGMVTYESPSAARILGYPEGFLVGKSPLTMLHADDTASAARDIEDVLNATNDGLPSGFRMKKADGSWSYLEVVGSNQLDNPGIKGIVLNVRDVTERRRAEEEILESEEKYRTLYESSDDAIFLIDDISYIDCNRKALTVFGCDVREEIVGSMVYRFSPKRQRDGRDSVEVGRERIAAAMTGHPQFFEWRHIRRDGSAFDSEVALHAFDFRGRRLLQAIVRDVTESKKAEAELLRLSTAIEHAAEEVIITDADGVITYVNPAFEQITGYSRQEALGRTPRILKSGAHPAAFYENLWETIKSGKTWKNRITNRRKDGREIQEDATINPILNGAGEITGFVSLKRDVTEEVKLESQLQRIEKMDAIGTLAAGIAHDFNNILTGIQGHASLMQLELSPDHPYFRRLESINQQVGSGANLTRQILGFARGGKYEVVPTNINRLLIRGAELFGRTRKDIDIRTGLEQDIWTVSVDQGQIEQVLLNIFINAGQAMAENGDLYLETRNVTFTDEEVKPYGAAPGRFVRVSVTDTGTGMDRETQDRIFEPFFTTKKPGEGTGLGLMSAYGIVRNHGGFITVCSEVGQGSTFNIYLPVSDGTAPETPGGSDQLPFGHETILVVDDDRMNIATMKELLERLGYRVLTAGSGQEAVAIAMEGRARIDLVILDMIMPGMGGGKTFDALRQIDPDMKIVVCSGYAASEEARRIMDRGCKGFIQKPFRLRELAGLIRQALGDGRLPLSS